MLSIPRGGIAALVLAFSLHSIVLPASCSAQDGSPAGPVPPEMLKSRRQRLLEALEGAPAVLPSAGSRGEYAQDSDYREDNNFFYLTGLEAPGARLVLNGAGLEEIVLFLPPRTQASERWTGPQFGPGDRARELAGLAEVRSTEDLEGELGELVAGPQEAGALAPFLADLRLVKDAEEIRRLRRAVEITAEAHRELWRFAEAGSFEYQLEAVLEYVFKAQGAERVGFPSIVGSGPNSVILHYDENRRALRDGDLVVVDIGAEYGYYTADLTRTFPVGGRFSPRQKALYDLVLGAREAGLEMIRPGATIREVNQAVRGFLEASSGDICGEESCAPFLIHGVSHWLGMDVHDVGGNNRPFAPGMVLTLEPGLYLPEESLGIRVEDDILVTETGHEVLSEDLPRSTEEIEAIMAEGPRWVKDPFP